MDDLWILLIVILELLVFAVIFWRFFSSRLAPVKTEKATVVDKFKTDDFSKIYSATAKPPVYTVVFAAKSKKRSFQVSAFSYQGTNLKKQEH